MTVFLKPTGEPFFGGTYFPPEPRHGLPSFKQVLIALSDAWKEQRDEIDRSGAKLVEHIRSAAHLQASNDPLTAELLDESERNLRDGFDAGMGRMGPGAEVPAGAGARVPARAGASRDDDPPHARPDGARRHVRPGRRRLPSLLRRRALARPALREDALRQRAACVRLPACRQEFGEDRYRFVADQTIDYVLRELALDGGGFASAQDADTEGVEGLTFTWAPGEGAPEDCSAVRGRPLRPPWGARRRNARAAARAARPAAEAAARRQGDRVVERPDARCACSGRRGSSPRSGSPSSCSGRSRRRRTPAPHVARRRREGDGLPRGLRRRRLRAAGAARRDR